MFIKIAKIMTLKKLILISAVLLSALLFTLVLALEKFYARYEQIEKRLEASLAYDDSTANAIKHATAASDMFTLLRNVIGTTGAEKAVIFLGVLNEYIEQVKYPNDPDSAREIMKDLHNNYVGINAAKIANNTDAFQLILALANNRTLIVNRIYNPFFTQKEPQVNAVSFGYDWFDKHREQIDSRIEMKLKRANRQKNTDTFRISSVAHKSASIE